MDEHTYVGVDHPDAFRFCQYLMRCPHTGTVFYVSSFSLESGTIVFFKDVTCIQPVNSYDVTETSRRAYVRTHSLQDYLDQAKGSAK